ncbi:hypothetical protein DRQ07_01505 [candidate division KSB1 bacterium]|nr:MAG: hypothetical protein DRQ07_01505 [candidate division KSB1 bacterium]
MKKIIAIASVFIFLSTASSFPEDLYLNTVYFYGNNRTKRTRLLKLLNLKSGQKVNREDILNLKRFLIRERLLNRAEIILKRNSGSAGFSMFLIVKERGLLSVDPVIGDNDVFGIYLGSGISFYNFAGYGNTVKFVFQRGGISKQSVDFYNKWFGPGLLFSYMTGYSEVWNLYRFNDIESQGLIKLSLLSASSGINISRSFNVAVEAGINTISFEDNNFMVSGSGTDNLTYWGITGRIDTRDLPWYPCEGIFTKLGFKNWLFSGSSLFRQLDFESRFYFSVKRDIVALRVKASAYYGSVPFYKRIHMGGGRTLRGYRTGSVYGDRSVLFNAEYRHSIFHMDKPMSGTYTGLFAVFFIDTGSAWFNKTDLSKTVFHSSVGAGVHVIIDKLVLRAEYGYRGKGIGFFGLGTGVMF